MKHYLMKKFGPILGLVALAGVIAGFTFAPASCSLNPQQQQRLQAIAVPASSIFSAVAVRQGWIEPGDKVTVQRSVAIVTSPDSAEVKLFALAELGLDEALKKGLLDTGDVVTVDTPTQVSITSPPQQAPGPAIPIITREPAKEPVLQLSPPPGG